ncbi:MAG: hypothetical protein KDJ29_06290 [Hyphomicrobiales bacterium]|nr:hypothetical protein [Hyphomicrobiales bacterium]
MSETKKTPLALIEAPYSRDIRIEEVRYESGMTLMRLTIREGRRYTILEIDPPTAAKWSQVMAGWAAGAVDDE